MFFMYNLVVVITPYNRLFAVSGDRPLLNFLGSDLKHLSSVRK
jgi:hypothetical protein